MPKRFLSIWFRHLTTDRLEIEYPQLKRGPFVLASPERGRMTVKAVSTAAVSAGVWQGMAVADARAIVPTLEVFPDEPDLERRLLKALARWCLRYTPVVAPDPPDGLILNITGCAHLWGGEPSYLENIRTILQGKGYHVRTAIADTIGTAWAVARYGQGSPLVQSNAQREALLPLPPAALRLDMDILQRMDKIGFRKIGQFIDIPPSLLHRRFGVSLLTRLEQALGSAYEHVQAVRPLNPYVERLPCLEPICTAAGIAIALKRLLETLCKRLSKEGRGIRTGVFKGYRIDGKIEQVTIGTGKASRNPTHLFKLFELKLSSIEPALGIELFELEAPLTEKVRETQAAVWHTATGDSTAIAELLDNIAGKVGMNSVHRYLPQEHHWPERSIKEVPFLDGELDMEWPVDRNRPLHLLPKPQPIEVMAPLPDYPPLHFRYKGMIIKIVRADGPERIEQEWWLQTGPPRDYYCVEDGNGARYWLFRSGLYNEGKPQWFIHGFFA